MNTVCSKIFYKTIDLQGPKSSELRSDATSICEGGKPGIGLGCGKWCHNVEGWNAQHGLVSRVLVGNFIRYSQMSSKLEETWSIRW